MGNLSSSMLSTLSSSLDHGGNDELGGATAAAMEFIVDRVTTNAPTLDGGNVAASAMEAPPSETYNGGFIFDRLTPEPTPGPTNAPTPNSCTAIPQERLPKGSWATTDTNCGKCEPPNNVKWYPCNKNPPICEGNCILK